MKIIHLLIFLLAGILSVAQEYPGNTPDLNSLLQFHCNESDVTIEYQGNAISALPHPQGSSLVSSFQLKGPMLYNEIRILVLESRLYTLDKNGAPNENCQACFDHAINWGSIAGGSLKNFSSDLSDFLSANDDPRSQNIREIVFTAPEPTVVDDLVLDLYFAFPGVNPEGECMLSTEFLLQFTFRNTESFECDIIIHVNEIFRLNYSPYTLLKDKLDGFYYPAFKSTVKFKFVEPYHITPGTKLNYTIYDKMHNPVNTDESGNIAEILPMVNLKSGANYIDLNLSGIDALEKNQFYTLEVISEKNEKSFLRFLLLE